MNKKSSLSAAAFLLSASYALASDASSMVSDSDSDWSVKISPYLWVAGVDVETTLDRSPPTTPPSTSQFESKIVGGALLAAQVHYKSVGLWVDFVWVQTDTSSVQPGPFFSSMDLETDFYHSTVALSYILPTSKKLHAEVIAGARFWSVSAEITAGNGWLPGFVARQEETWVTPVVGVDLKYDLNPNWSLLLKGTVGVGDGDSEGWEAMGAVAYRFGETWSTMLGYRYLHEEYARQRFTYFTDVTGIVLGVSCRF